MIIREKYQNNYNCSKQILIKILQEWRIKVIEQQNNLFLMQKLCKLFINTSTMEQFHKFMDD